MRRNCSRYAPLWDWRSRRPPEPRIELPSQSTGSVAQKKMQPIAGLHRVTRRRVDQNFWLYCMYRKRPGTSYCGSKLLAKVVYETGGLRAKMLFTPRVIFAFQGAFQ